MWYIFRPTVTLPVQTFATSKRISLHKRHLKGEQRKEKSSTSLVPRYAAVSKAVDRCKTYVKGIGAAGKFLGMLKIFARISLNCLCEYFFPHKSCLGWHPKKVFMWFSPRWGPFSSLFSGILRTFHRFFPDFRQIKTFGGALSPRLLHHWCKVTDFVPPPLHTSQYCIHHLSKNMHLVTSPQLVLSC